MLVEPSMYNDIIWGEIQLNELEIKLLTEWEPLRRLDGISQLGLARIKYPNAKHSRLEHSIGVMHIAGRMAKWLGLENKVAETRILGLLHDVGHGPFSHVMERALPLVHTDLRSKDHEWFTNLLLGSEITEQEFSKIADKKLIEHIKRQVHVLEGMLGTAFLKRIRRMIESKDYPFLLITDDIGADRIDYFIRDSYYTDLPTGGIAKQVSKSLQNNMIRLNMNGRLKAIGFKEEALDAIELLLIARKYHFKNVAHAPRTRIAEKRFLRKILAFLNNRDDRTQTILRWFLRGDDNTVLADFLISRIEDLSNDLGAMKYQKNFRQVRVPFWHLFAEERLYLVSLVKHRKDLIWKLEEEIGKKIRENLGIVDETRIVADIAVSLSGSLPHLFIKVRYVDAKPFAFARDRSVALQSLALEPLKDGGINIYCIDGGDCGDLDSRNNLRNVRNIVSGAIQNFINDYRATLSSTKWVCFWNMLSLPGKERFSREEIYDNDEVKSIFADSNWISQVDGEDVKGTGGLKGPTLKLDIVCPELEDGLLILYCCGCLNISRSTIHHRGRFTYATPKTEYIVRLNSHRLERENARS